MDLEWILFGCMLPSIIQGIAISLPILGSGLILRVLVTFSFTKDVLNTLATVLGLYVLWWYYDSSVFYFIALSVLSYVTLLLADQRRGFAVSSVTLVFILVCELFLVSAAEWHRVRGSILVVVMKVVSLGFDLEAAHREEHKKPLVPVPDFLHYASYCLFPATTVFGPFMTYHQHLKFLTPTPLSWSWLAHVSKSFVAAIVWLCLSACVMPFLFNEPDWNKWLAAYSAAASFRYSHYFVSYLSESATLVAGIGYELSTDGSLSWSNYHVAYPPAIELPRSLGMVVTNWNFPIHYFLKHYVFKPARLHLGKFGAILATYFASSLLHGINFQLAAVLLSIGVYTYVESVLRYKLSIILKACVLDRPCLNQCNHQNKHKKWVFVINCSFTVLSMFHLAYLGLMFGVNSEDEHHNAAEGYSMMHTLKKWAHLDFLSHWAVLATFIVYKLLNIFIIR